MPVADHAATIQQHIAEYGEALTLRKTNLGSYDQVTGTYSSIGSPVDTAFRGRVRRYRREDIDGNSVLPGDMEVRAAPASIGATPAKGDRLLRGGVLYRIEEVVLEAAGDTPLLYILQIRGLS